MGTPKMFLWRTGDNCQRFIIKYFSLTTLYHYFIEITQLQADFPVKVLKFLWVVHVHVIGFYCYYYYYYY